MICPLARDRRELSFAHIRNNYEIVFHDAINDFLEQVFCKDIGYVTYMRDPSRLLMHMIQEAQEENVAGVFSSGDYPGSVFSNIVAYALNLPGVLPETVLRLQHKYYARDIQKKYVPEATPYYMLLNIDTYKNISASLPFPFFVKPVKSFFSIFANTAHTIDDVRTFLSECRMPQQFLDEFAWFMYNYSAHNPHADALLAEELLQGMQVTIEGYVYNGQVEIIGIVDSVMFPGTISFERFEYPSSLSNAVQERMHAITCVLMKGVQFDNSFFNIEMMYNPAQDTIHIIEVNTRLASQFSDLYEKVDGTNSYTYALDVAAGLEPRRTIRQGAYNTAASLVLRIFEDKLIERMPTLQEIEYVHELFPDVRIQLYGTEGERLSSEPQDGKSFRYGLINLGARDRQELEEKYEACKALLQFKFT